MIKRILLSIILVISGFMLGIITVIIYGDSLMLVENECRYDFNEAVALLDRSVVEQGWTIPAIHDLQKSMKKFGKDVNRVHVFAICNPDHAEKILKGNDERIISTMMPCRISVYEKDNGKVYISRMNSKIMSLGMSKNIRKVMREAYGDTERILSHLMNE